MPCWRSGCGRLRLRPPRRPTASSALGSLPDELLALTSLNAREGVRRIGGKLDAYIRQLRRFREHYAGAADTLRQLAESGPLREVQEYCHALKGVAGNLGAMALYESVNAIDAQLKQGVRPDAVALDDMQQCLQALMHDIDSLRVPAAAAAAPIVPFAPAELHARLEQLARALESDLGRVEPLLDELRAGVDGSPLAGDIDALAAQVDVFAIDEARVQLDALLGSLNPPQRTRS